MKKNQYFFKRISVCAVMISLATVLSIFPTISAPLGGSITAGSMLPIMLVSFLLGKNWGIPTAIGYSLIQLILGFSSVASWGLSARVFVLCLIFDYVLAYSSLCSVCIFGSSDLKKTVCGIIFAGFLRFLCHFLSGWFFFGTWAQEGFSAFTWAIVYNASYMIPETAICSVIIIPLYRTFPFLRKQLRL